MKVLIADKFEESGIASLTAAGCEVLYKPDLVDERLANAIRDSGVDVLVVRSTKVTEPMLDTGRLSLVVRAGAGVNTIDVAAASKRGIYVSNCPGRNAIAVAELAFGLIGFGSIGQEMARRARGFGMPVLVWSRRFLERGAAALEDVSQDMDVTVINTPEEVAERSDILSVHMALTDDTRNFVGTAILGRMKPGAFFVNTARAEVVDYVALAEAVKTRGLRVGLDVYAAEPSTATGEFSDPIVGLPHVYGTHHIGASTDQAQEAIAAETVGIIRAYKETGTVPNVVNLSKQTRASHMLVVRHRDKPGVLAHVFNHLRSGNLNVQETENIIFEGGQAAIARINLDSEPPAALLRAIEKGNEDILNLHLVNI